MESSELVNALKALSVPARLKIVELLRSRRLCVNALTKRLGISQPAVSQHLGILRRAGLVESQKIGTKVHYSVNSVRLEQIKTALSRVGLESESKAESVFLR